LCFLGIYLPVTLSITSESSPCSHSYSFSSNLLALSQHKSILTGDNEIMSAWPYMPSFV